MATNEDFIIRFLVPDFGATKTLKVAKTDIIGTLIENLKHKFLIPPQEEALFGIYIQDKTAKGRWLDPKSTIAQAGVNTGTTLEFRKKVPTGELQRSDTARGSTWRLFGRASESSPTMRDQRLSSFAKQNSTSTLLEQPTSEKEKESIEESDLVKPVASWKIRDLLGSFFATRADQDKLIKKGVLKEEIHSERLAPLSLKIIEQVVAAVETKCLDSEGIYRVSGQSAAIKELARSFAKPDFSTATCLKYQIHEITGALKLYFRELLPPVVPYESFEPLITSNKRFSDTNERVKELENIFSEMPEDHRKCFERVCQHCLVVIANEKTNMMNARNLSIVLGPGLMKPKVQPDPMTLVSQSEAICDVMQFIITHCETIFQNVNKKSNVNQNHSSQESLRSSGVNYYTLIERLKTQQTNEAINDVAKIVNDPKALAQFHTFLKDKIEPSELISIMQKLAPLLKAK